MEQIITEEGQLVDNLEQHIEKIGIAKAGVDYHTISIIGPQSSGKSTILNHLFGTTFKTMNSDFGRQQTTKGIHASSCVDSSIIVFDVEGCDSRERGDADAPFERKAALFALALSEVLIINMWETDIGRYQASNIPLLKVVFEVNLQLFLAQQQTKTKILFLIRDFTAQSFDKIKDNLLNLMEDIWKDIQIPEELEGKKLDDFFDFAYFPVHHFYYQRPLFDQDIQTLKEWFVTESNPNYLFNIQTGKIVPGDGLSHYIRSLWDVIHNNKELNVPSQRAMLSHFKCEETVKEIMQELTDELDDTIVKAVKKGKKPIDNFKAVCQISVDKAFEKYKSGTWRYIPEVVEEKQELLKQSIDNFLYPLFCLNCSHNEITFIKEFNEFLASYGDELKPGSHWKEDVKNKEEDIKNRFIELTKTYIVSPFQWTYDLSTITRNFSKIETTLQVVLIQGLHDSVCSSTLHSFDEEANEILKEAPDDMWSRLRSLLNSSIISATDKITEILSTNVPNEKPDPNIRRLFEDRAIHLVTDSAKYVKLKMKAAFDVKFNFDEKGRPRVWTLNDDINEIFQEARSRGIQVLRLFTMSHLRDPNSEPIEGIDHLSRILIQSDEVSEITEEFDQTISHSYINAQETIKAQKSQQQIPLWGWFLLLFLGWDKILKFLSNPFILFFTILFVFGYFIMKQLGLSEIVMEKLQESLASTMEKLKNNDKNGDDSDDKKDSNEEEDEEEEIMDLTQPIVEELEEKIVHRRNMSYQNDNNADDGFSFLENEK